MRSYPRNSPQAAGRLVALVLLADGHVCRSEFATLEALDAPRALGLPADAIPQIVQDLCEDLLLGAWHGGSMLDSVDEPTLAQLMAEVDDPALRREVLRLAHAAAGADNHLADGEAFVLNAARRFWRLEVEALPS
jgi:hypothetical protein